jgi:hypothetical protein
MYKAIAAALFLVFLVGACASTSAGISSHDDEISSEVGVTIGGNIEIRGDYSTGF